MKNDNQKPQAAKPGIGSAYSQQNQQAAQAQQPGQAQQPRQVQQPGQTQRDSNIQNQSQPGDGNQSSAPRHSDDAEDARKRDAGRKDVSEEGKPALNMAGSKDEDEGSEQADADKTERAGSTQA